jgi:lipopolysaccharide export LptBFGC system permease protein LptF
MCTSNFDASSSLANYASSKNGMLEIGTGLQGVTQATNNYFQATNQNNYIDAQANALNNTANSYGQTSRDVIEKNRDQLAWLGYQSQAENAKTINDQAFRGIDTNVGSAYTTRQGQQLVDQVNMNNARYNAMLQSFGYQRAELNAQQKSESLALNKTNPWLSAVSTLGKTALSIYGVSGSTAGATTNASSMFPTQTLTTNASVYPTINSIYNF